MRFRLLGAAVAFAFLVGGAAVAQPASSKLSSEQLTRIKEHVNKERRAPGAAPPGLTVAVGGTLPQDVPVYAFPAEVGVANYRYAVVGRQVILVAADTRQVHEVWGISY